MSKKIIYVLLPLQILILIFSPRFGWKMHGPEAVMLSFGGTTYVDGRFHTLYENENRNVDISYDNIFSKKFLIVVDNTNEYQMEVGIDGVTHNTDTDYPDANIIWNDSCGIFWWRYILTIAMTTICIILIKRAGRIQVISCILYVISILISLRIFL